MTAPTMDERRAVARRMRGYDCPVLPSQQTTMEAVDAVVECMGLEDDEEMCTVRHFLDRLADLIDPGDGMDEDGRAALDWVREHGGVEHIKEQGEALARRLSALAQEAVADADPEDEAEALDVLERAVNCRLMPEGMEWLVEAWPRFEDGEPVRFLDNFERDGDENGVSAVTMYLDGSFALNFRAYSKGERVKRPAPKVLDADGVEIREGDTVYYVDGREQRVNTVARLTDDGCVQFGRINEARYVTYYEAACIQPNLLTHRAPVLAADGKPLRVGDTVWYANGDGLQLTVVRVEGDRVVTTSARDGEQWWAAYILTHEQPDSWERLERDANVSTCTYFGATTKDCEICGHVSWECSYDKDSDLVRRAKKLAGRDAS